MNRNLKMPNPNSLTSAIPAHLTKLSAGLWKWITSQVFVPHVIVKEEPEIGLCLFAKADRSKTAVMTLKEYLMDYASPETKAIGDRLIDREVLNVPNEKARAVVLENLKLIEQDNRRDFRF